MEMLHKNPRQAETAAHKQKVGKKAPRIKLEFDKELQALSGTILFPEKLAMANKFLSKH
jgi:hypothetical protein